MKKTLFPLVLCTSIFGYSQIGINTSTPNASLDIVSKGNTNATKALIINDNTNKELLSVSDIGEVRLENYKNINLLGTDANGYLKSAQALNIPSLSAIGTVIANTVLDTGVYTIPFTVNKLDNTLLTYDTNTRKFTVMKAGYYSIKAYANYILDSSAPTGGSGRTSIFKGTTIISTTLAGYGDGTQSFGQNTSATVFFNIGDTIHVTTNYTLKFRVDKGSIDIVYYGE